MTSQQFFVECCLAAGLNADEDYHLLCTLYLKWQFHRLLFIQSTNEVIHLLLMSIIMKLDLESSLVFYSLRAFLPLSVQLDFEVYTRLYLPHH